MSPAKTKLKIRNPIDVEKSEFLSAWLITLACFLLVRVLYLIFLNPYYFAKFSYEELNRGMMAYDFWKGLNFPFIDYRPDDYSGAWMFVGSITSIFFQLFKPTMFSLKLTPLVFSTLSLYFWFKVLWEQISKRTAQYFAVLFIFAPPFFINYTLTNLGDFSEVIFFSGAAIYFFFKIPHKIENAGTNTILKKSDLASLLTGLFLGFGTWYNYHVGLTAISLVLFWFLNDKTFFKTRSFLIFLFACAVGFAPWFYFQTTHSLQTFNVHSRPLLDHFNLSFLIKGLYDYRSFLGFDLAESFGPGIWGMSFTYKKACMIVYTILFFSPAFLFGFLWLIPGNERRSWLMTTENPSRLKRSPLLFFVCYFILLFFVHQASDFRDNNQLMPFLPLIFTATAFCFSKIDGAIKSGQTGFRMSLWSIIALVSVACSSPFMSYKHVGSVFTTKGYSYQFVDASVCKDVRTCLKNYSQISSSLSPEDLHEFSTALAMQVAFEIEKHDLRQTVRQLTAMMPSEFEPYFYYFLGRDIVEREQSIYDAFRELRFLENYNPFLYNFALQGMFDSAALENVKDLKSIIYKIDDSVMNYYWRAVAQQEAFKWAQDGLDLDYFRTELQKRIREIPTDYQSWYLQGVGKHLYELWSRRPLLPRLDPSSIQNLPKPYLKYIFEGVGIAMAERGFIWQIAPKNWYWREFASDLNSFNQFHIQAGKKYVLEFLDL